MSRALTVLDQFLEGAKLPKHRASGEITLQQIKRNKK
jgi:hypothetical protein